MTAPSSSRSPLIGAARPTPAPPPSRLSETPYPAPPSSSEIERRQKGGDPIPELRIPEHPSRVHLSPADRLRWRQMDEEFERRTIADAERGVPGYKLASDTYTATRLAAIAAAEQSREVLAALQAPSDPATDPIAPLLAVLEELATTAKDHRAETQLLRKEVSEASTTLTTVVTLLTELLGRR